MTLVMDIARYKILKSKRHIKKQVHWWFYVQEYVCMVNLLTKTILQIVYKKNLHYIILYYFFDN
jgi:hypothetical protein